MSFKLAGELKLDSVRMIVSSEVITRSYLKQVSQLRGRPSFLETAEDAI